MISLIISMPAKKGTKYLNAKTYSILSKYTPEDIQKLLNSGKFKSVIARPLKVITTQNFVIHNMQILSCFFSSLIG